MKIDDLLEQLPPSLTPQERSDIERAYKLAATAHAGQTRASGEPYISHCVAVARILCEMNLPASVIVAGLLHDTVEDTKVTLDDIRREFGDEVARFVDGVTKLTNLPRVSRLDKPRAGNAAPDDYLPEDRADLRSHDRDAETIRKTFQLGEDEPEIKREKRLKKS